MASSENKHWLQEKLAELKDEATNALQKFGFSQTLNQAKLEIVSPMTIHDRKLAVLVSRLFQLCARN